MRDDHNEKSFAATGVGAALAGMLSMFARSADDIGRMGVHCVDDVSRACVTTSDDIASVIARSGDDLSRPIDDFHVPNYVKDLRLDPVPPSFAIQKSDDVVSVTAHIAKQIAEGTIKTIDLNDGEDN